MLVSYSIWELLYVNHSKNFDAFRLFCAISLTEVLLLQTNVEYVWLKWIWGCKIRNVRYSCLKDTQILPVWYVEAFTLPRIINFVYTVKWRVLCAELFYRQFTHFFCTKGFLCWSSNKIQNFTQTSIDNSVSARRYIIIQYITGIKTCFVFATDFRIVFWLDGIPETSTFSITSKS